MRFALYQFGISKNQSENHRKIKRAALESAENGAQVFITQECAMSGYPPVEIKSTSCIDFKSQEETICDLMSIAKKHRLHILLGLVRQDTNVLKNSILCLLPDGSRLYYDKRALWGWDMENFVAGSDFPGIITVNGIRLGVRICFEIRFPEYFRELYKKNVDIAVVSFCDISSAPNQERRNLIMSHLVTRAIENAFTILSVNSTTSYQTAPTCVIDPDGNRIIEAPSDQETIVYYDYEKSDVNFGRKGRIYYSDLLTKDKDL